MKWFYIVLMVLNRTVPFAKEHLKNHLFRSVILSSSVYVWGRIEVRMMKWNEMKKREFSNQKKRERILQLKFWSSRLGVLQSIHEPSLFYKCCSEKFGHSEWCFGRSLHQKLIFIFFTSLNHVFVAVVSITNCSCLNSSVLCSYFEWNSFT